MLGSGIPRERCSDIIVKIRKCEVAKQGEGGLGAVGVWGCDPQASPLKLIQYTYIFVLFHKQNKNHTRTMHTLMELINAIPDKDWAWDWQELSMNPRIRYAI